MKVLGGILLLGILLSCCSPTKSELRNDFTDQHFRASILDSLICNNNTIYLLNKTDTKSIWYPNMDSKSSFAEKLFMGEEEAINLAIASIISFKSKPMVGEFKNYTRNKKHDFRFRGQKMINALHTLLKNQMYCHPQFTHCSYYYHIGHLLDALKPTSSDYDMNIPLTKIFNEELNKYEETSLDSCFCNAAEREYDYILSEIDKGNLIQKEFGEL